VIPSGLHEPIPVGDIQAQSDNLAIASTEKLGDPRRGFSAASCKCERFHFIAP
jgi:hypothetical protein